MGITAPREETGSPAPDREGEGGGEPGLRRAPTRGAQRRALLAAALLSRGALFRHLWPLSLPWRGSKGAAPTGGEENVGKERGEEAAVPDKAGGAPVAEKMDEDVGEGEVLPPEDEEMNMLKGIALGDEDERSGWARVRRLGKSKSPHLPPGVSDVSSPQTPNADRDQSQGERESESETANQSRVTGPAGQWEPGEENTSRRLTPPHPHRVLLGRTRGGSNWKGGGGRGGR